MSTVKSMLRHRGYSGSAEVSVEDNCMHGRILHIDDIITYEAQTVAELQSEFSAAVDRYLEHCRRIGKAPNKPYSGSLNVRIGPDLHRAISEYATQRDVSTNVAICEAIARLVDPPADKVIESQPIWVSRVAAAQAVAQQGVVEVAGRSDLLLHGSSSQPMSRTH